MLTFEKKYIYEKINDSEGETNRQGSSINQKHNSTMSVILCVGATFVKKNYCLVTRIVSFDTVGFHLLNCRILELYPSKDIALDLSHVISLLMACIIVSFKSYLN